jgi:hypothetical protein
MTGAERELCAAVREVVENGESTWSALGKRDLIVPAASPGLATVLVAEQLGRYRYHGPHLEATVAADVLSGDLRARVVAGETVVSVDLAALAPHATPTFLRFAADSSHLLMGDPEGELLLYETGAPGVTLRRYDDLGASELFTAHVDAVPVERLRKEDWPEIRNAAQTRLAAYLIGLAGGALDETVEYTKRRRQFGRPIASFQSVSFRLAALAARLEAARMFVYHAGARIDDGLAIDRIAPQSLALAARLAREVTADAIQLHGAVGMTQQAPVALCYRMAAVAGCLLGSPTALLRTAADRLASDPYAARFAITDHDKGVRTQ